MSKPSSALLGEGFFQFKKNASPGLCWVRGCANKSRGDRCLCSKHTMQRWRAKNKKTADFCTLRDHSRARRIPFQLTLDYWRGITDAFGFYDYKEDEILTIDRVNPMRGYTEGNIRVVTISVNCYKSNKERYLPEHVQHMLERQRAETQEENQEYLAMDPSQDDEELPF